MEAMTHITGYAGTEVEVRANGAVAKFRLACTPRIKAKGEWCDGNTTWIEVTCFRALAEHVAASVRKGDPLIVVGRLRTSVWSKDGETHERLVLEADSLGHDLNRGTASFRRKPRPVLAESADEPPPDETEEAGLTAEERAAQAA